MRVRRPRIDLANPLTNLESADIAHFTARLQQCNRTKNATAGIQTHKQIVDKNLDQVTILRNLLVQMYGNCRRIDQASQIFHSTRDRNDFSWNVMIAAYARNGHLAEAKRTFDEMPSEWRGVFTSNTLMVAYAQRGDLAQAREFFDQMPARNVFSWNVMISTYAQRGSPQDALKIWKKMDVAPDRITYTSAVTVCGDLQDATEGRSIHALVAKSGLLPSDLVLATALVDMYGKLGLPREAEDVFQPFSSSSDVVLWTAMQGVYARNGDLLQASKLFHEMPIKDVVAWTNMVVAYATCGNIERARDFFEEMSERNTITWTAMISAYVQNGLPKKALELLLLMDLEGFPANNVTFVSALDACAAIAEIAQGRRIHTEVSDSGMRCDVKLQTAVVNMFGKCGCLQEARRYFDQMKEKNVWSWNAMITAYAQKGPHEQAIKLFESLNLEGETPDEVTFMAVLSACSHAGLLEAGRSCFTSLATDYGHSLTIAHYACMIDLLGRTGKLVQAEELLNSMPFAPNSTAVTALLNACEMHRDAEMARRLPKQAIGHDHGPYILLSNIESNI